MAVALKRKPLRQTTLDHQQVRLPNNRLGDLVARPYYPNPLDYSLFVIGSARIRDRGWIYAQLEEFVQGIGRDPKEVILPADQQWCTDEVVANWAEERGIDMITVPIARYLHKWPRERYQWTSFKQRNLDMVDRADKVLALWDGESTTVDIARHYACDIGKETRLIVYPAEEERM